MSKGTLLLFDIQVQTETTNEKIEFIFNHIILMVVDSYIVRVYRVGSVFIDHLATFL